MCLSQFPNASHRTCSKTVPNCVWVKIQSHLIENILRQFQIVPQPNSNCISSKIFYDISNLCLSQIPIAPHRKNFKTIPVCVLAKFQLHLIENILKPIQIASLQIPISSYRKYAETVPNCVLAKFQLQLMEKNLRQIQIVS